MTLLSRLSFTKWAWRRALLDPHLPVLLTLIRKASPPSSSPCLCLPASMRPAASLLPPPPPGWPGPPAPCAAAAYRPSVRASIALCAGGGGVVRPGGQQPRLLRVRRAHARPAQLPAAPVSGACAAARAARPVCSSGLLHPCRPRPAYLLPALAWPLPPLLAGSPRTRPRAPAGASRTAKRATASGRSATPPSACRCPAPALAPVLATACVDPPAAPTPGLTAARLPLFCPPASPPLLQPRRRGAVADAGRGGGVGVWRRLVPPQAAHPGCAAHSCVFACAQWQLAQPARVAAGHALCPLLAAPPIVPPCPCPCPCLAHVIHTAPQAL